MTETIPALLSGYLEYLTDAILNSVNLDTAKGHKLKLLKVITSPFTSLVIKVRYSPSAPIVPQAIGHAVDTILLLILQRHVCRLG